MVSKYVITAFLAYQSMVASALIFPTGRNPLPPSARVLLRGTLSLRKDCDAYVQANHPQSRHKSIWFDANNAQGYEIANVIFETITSYSSQREQMSATIWLPKLGDSDIVSELAEIIRDNSERLDGWDGVVEAWPKAPATGITLQREFSREEHMSYSDESPESISEAISATETWVDDILGGLGLCPYTASMRRAAVGLGSVGVKEGPVLVRHIASEDATTATGATDAAILAASFWRGVVDLATMPEDQVATFLLVAPSYDDNFAEFIAACDGLLERSAKAAGADEVIGKAWFHPQYDSSVVGQSQILPGHALPSRMVKEFIDKYYGDDTSIASLDLESIAKANDAVRHTPHATVNLLRRSQLTASKEAEAAAGSKKTNLIYARNVVRLSSLQ